MHDEESKTRTTVLTWLLRGLGTVDLLAVAVVFVPFGWIEASNRTIGLQELPELPLVDYLLRSTAALYALHGALMLGLSSDVVRYRPLIRLLGVLAMVHGLIMVWVDVTAGMPVWWRIAEGPTFAVCGLALWMLTARRESARPPSE